MSTHFYHPDYSLLQDMVKEHGGRMVYIPGDEITGGAWFISVEEKHTYFPCYKSTFQGIEELYVPKVNSPMNIIEYKNELIPNAWEKLLDNMKDEVFLLSGDDQDLVDYIVLYWFLDCLFIP